MNPRMTLESSDLELLAAWQGGDLHAGRALFERYFDSVLGFFRRRAPGFEEDLTQRVLLGCVEGRRRFRGDSSFRTYLFRIARFVLLGHYRERRRHYRFEPLSDDQSAKLTSPSGVIAGKQTYRLLLTALRRLPKEQREVLTLSYWHNLSGAEIGRLLAIPATTARSRIQAANERLRELIDALESAPVPRADALAEVWKLARRIQIEPRRTSDAQASTR